jgi:hypothetical protein
MGAQTLVVRVVWFKSRVNFELSLHDPSQSRECPESLPDRYPPPHSSGRVRDNAFNDDLRDNEDDARKQSNEVEHLQIHGLCECLRELL